MATRRVGLLFVHGIGEQKQFEHLRNSVRDLAELLKRAHDGARVSVVDRTNTPRDAGDPDIAGLPPITLSVIDANGDCTEYHCHEVWWADLGERASLFQSIRFWSWGLGQWAAPIYRDLDISHGRPSATGEYAVSRLPPSAADGAFWLELLVRIRLAWAALTAAFSFASWSLLKRIFGSIVGAAPDPDLIVQYVGDVRTFERRATPNSSPVSDPGHPVRVAIRRRMVTQMVAMAARDLDGWFVLAHSLGTVVAYNGLTELGHTLPNYLPKSLWEQLPPALKFNTGTRLRPDDQIKDMMPARPAWLDKRDVIDRRRLFERLDGVLTYGSPLEKFAAIWPRIVATADDRTDGNPFQRDPDRCTQWLNVAAPHDPVAGILNAFCGKRGGSRLQPHLPELVNWESGFDAAIGLSHIRYFRNEEAFVTGRDIDQRVRIARWLHGPNQVTLADDIGFLRLRRIAGFVGYAIVSALLVGLTLLLVALAGPVITAVLTVSRPAWPGDWGVLWTRMVVVAGPTIGLVLAVVAAAGVLRWTDEAVMNARFALADKSQKRRTRIFLTIMALAAFLLTPSAPIVLYAALGDLVPKLRVVDLCAGWQGTVAATAVAGTVILLQSLLNRAIRLWR